jgi:hypothetical protein
MTYKPLSDTRHRPLGATVRAVNAAADEVADLPGGVFFSALDEEEPADGLQGLYYKDGTDTVRRVRLARNGQFQFASLPEPASFRSVGEILLVPEVDPRAWAAVKDTAIRPLPELASLRSGSCFTALGANENPASQRRGVYRLGSDGMFRRLLKDPGRGLNWSDTIPINRFGHFSQSLAMHED